jgi:hypothetical protein
MRTAALAQELGVSAIIGPRELDGTIVPLCPGTDGKFVGIAAGYQQAGHKRIGFNTDSPIIPEEELRFRRPSASTTGSTTRRWIRSAA